MPRNAVKEVLAQKPLSRKVRSGKSASLNEAATLDLRIGFLIHDVSRLRRNLFDQFMKPLGVTRSQWWVIAHLSRRDGMIQTELASRLDVGKVTLGGLVDRLESGGWIRREADAGDRRMKFVFLTPKSYEVLRKMRSVEHSLNQHILKEFNADERDKLFELLLRLKSNIAAALLSSAESAKG